MKALVTGANGHLGFNLRPLGVDFGPLSVNFCSHRVDYEALGLYFVGI